MVPDTASRGVLLALAIILLWLAGLCFFIAFEGSSLLGGGSTGSQAEISQLVSGLQQTVQDTTAQQQGNG